MRYKSPWTFTKITRNARKRGELSLAALLGTPPLFRDLRRDCHAGWIQVKLLKIQLTPILIFIVVCEQILQLWQRRQDVLSVPMPLAHNRHVTIYQWIYFRSRRTVPFCFCISKARIYTMASWFSTHFFYYLLVLFFIFLSGIACSRENLTFS